MNKATTLLATGMLLSLAASAFAVTVDGTADGSYGIPVVVQGTQTQFGNANIALVDYANGSELDAAYARIEGGVLYLLIAGNLESNYNKLELFFDTKNGGQNPLRADNPNVDFDGLNRMSGLKFDTSFIPDYYVTFGGGYDGGANAYRLFANYAELLTGGSGPGYYLGTNGAVNGGPLSGGTNPNNIEITINNINVAGVNDGCGPSSGAGVTTGMELAIPLAALGNPSGCLTVFAAVNGGGHDYFSNQVLGSAPTGTCNIGEPHTADFNAVGGDQFFTVCGGATPTLSKTWGAVKTMYR